MLLAWGAFSILFMNKTKNNRIPRTARALQVEFLTDTSSSKKGDVVKAYKNDFGWVGEVNGKHYYFPVAMLRTPEVCKITVLA